MAPDKILQHGEGLWTQQNVFAIPGEGAAGFVSGSTLFSDGFEN